MIRGKESTKLFQYLNIESCKPWVKLMGLSFIFLIVKRSAWSNLHFSAFATEYLRRIIFTKQNVREIILERIKQIFTYFCIQI